MILSRFISRLKYIFFHDLLVDLNSFHLKNFYYKKQTYEVIQEKEVLYFQGNVVYSLLPMKGTGYFVQFFNADHQFIGDF